MLMHTINTYNIKGFKTKVHNLISILVFFSMPISRSIYIYSSQLTLQIIQITQYEIYLKSVYPLLQLWLWLLVSGTSILPTTVRTLRLYRPTRVDK